MVYGIYLSPDADRNYIMSRLNADDANCEYIGPVIFGSLRIVVKTEPLLRNSYCQVLNLVESIATDQNGTLIVIDLHYVLLYACICRT